MWGVGELNRRKKIENRYLQCLSAFDGDCMLARPICKKERWERRPPKLFRDDSLIVKLVTWSVCREIESFKPMLTEIVYLLEINDMTFYNAVRPCLNAPTAMSVIDYNSTHAGTVWQLCQWVGSWPIVFLRCCWYLTYHVTDICIQVYEC